MPWRTTDLVTIREEFVEQAMSGRHPVAALCNAYGISEKTGHKWLNRFKEEGSPGLSDRSRAPHETPHKISLEMRREILSLRERHPTWGPKKLRVVLRRKLPEKQWPAASSILCDFLPKHWFRSFVPAHALADFAERILEFESSVLSRASRVGFANICLIRRQPEGAHHPKQPRSVVTLRHAVQFPPRSSVLDLLRPQLIADRRWHLVLRPQSL